MKKIFIASSALFLITLFFWGVYNFAFKKETVVDSKDVLKETAGSKENKTVSVENKMKENIKAIVEDKVVGAAYQKNRDKIIYYKADSGTSWQVDSDGGKKEQISKKEIAGLTSLDWNTDKNKVIMTAKESSANRYLTYDFLADRESEIGKKADFITWDNMGLKIIYKYFDENTGKRSLNVADPDGSNWKILVEDLSYKKVSVKNIPQTSLVSFWNYPEHDAETKIQTVSILGGEIKQINFSKFGADYLWSPDGEKALVSSLKEKDGTNMTLGTINVKGEYNDLGIPTFTSKCVWSNDKKNIYCALPGGIPERSVLPDDYQQGKFSTKDTFWKIDVTTGAKERMLELAEMNLELDATNLFLSPTEDGLFFINKRDGKLYRMEL